MAEIELKNVRKLYGTVVALPGIDLSIEKGQFVTLLGPSGCGKTTTLRVIAGLEEPNGGEIHLAGRTVFSASERILVPPEQRHLGFVFQSYALWPHLKVDRNITLPLTESGLAKAEVESRLLSVLGKVKLDTLRDRYPSELSGGQQQRVAVARLIAARTNIFLMDEPLSNLDAALRGEMRVELKQLHHELGATTIYVTHDQIEALTMSDVIVVMKDGLIQQQGTPFDIYHKPANLFVADFIGDPRINHFDAEVRRSGADLALVIGGLVVPFPGEIPTHLDRVVATVRPESLGLGPNPGQGGLEVTIEATLPMGSQTVIHVAQGDNRYVILEPGFSLLAVGSHAWLHVAGDKILCFDPTSGQSLAGPEREATKMGPEGMENERREFEDSLRRRPDNRAAGR